MTERRNSSTPPLNQAFVDRTAEWLLVNTVRDLERTTPRDADGYTALGTAPILRRTLTDNRPIIHASRRRLGISPPSFAFTEWSAADDLPVQYLGSAPILGLIDSERFSLPTKTTDLEGFLAAHVGEFPGIAPITVRDYIRYFAHVHGGVHLGQPEDYFAYAIQSTVGRGLMEVEDYRHPWNLLKAIGRVTLGPLREIAAAIEASSDKDVLQAP